jgi:hypothetical protein
VTFPAAFHGGPYTLVASEGRPVSRPVRVPHGLTLSSRRDPLHRREVASLGTPGHAFGLLDFAMARVENMLHKLSPRSTELGSVDRYAMAFALQ